MNLEITFFIKKPIDFKSVEIKHPSNNTSYADIVVPVIA
jgi:hypothetical protein